MGLKIAEFVLKYFPDYFEPLKETIIQSDINELYEKYIQNMIIYSFLIALGTGAYIFVIFNYVIRFRFPISFVTSILFFITTFLISFMAYHSYPFQLMESKRSSIETNLPFAINHMAAVAESGVPPYIMFKLLSNAKEYGEMSNEAKKIVRNVEIFGMDIVRAIEEVANRTPSPELRRFLYGVVSTIETGGDLRLYLKASSEEAIMDYRMKREKYLTTLSTYADFYTALLIAAPLFFISTLSVMSLVGGQVMGMSINAAMKLGVYVFMPLLNMLFLLFLQLTQPKI